MVSCFEGFFKFFACLACCGQGAEAQVVDFRDNRTRFERCFGDKTVTQVAFHKAIKDLQQQLKNIDKSSEITASKSANIELRQCQRYSNQQDTIRLLESWAKGMSSTLSESHLVQAGKMVVKDAFSLCYAAQYHGVHNYLYLNGGADRGADN